MHAEQDRTNTHNYQDHKQDSPDGRSSKGPDSMLATARTDSVTEATPKKAHAMQLSMCHF